VKPIIKLDHVHRTYNVKPKKIVAALKDINLAIKAGEMIAITGASGSGKSTLLQIIGGLDKASEGLAVVDGEDLGKLHGRKLASFRNTTVGFVYQSFYLQPFLSTAENVEIPLMFAKTAPTLRQEQVMTVLKAVGLIDRKDYLPKELSGGQIQRVAIARALINQPKIILADEPTGNLDTNNALNILRLFGDIRKRFGTTIVLVTHDSQLAALADRTITLKGGVLVS
jgi:ABC-type lipoprotein export system ATPase subunit